MMENFDQKKYYHKYSFYFHFKKQKLLILNVYLNLKAPFSKQNMTRVKELKLWQIKQAKNSDFGTASVLFCTCA